MTKGVMGLVKMTYVPSSPLWKKHRLHTLVFIYTIL